MAKQRNHENTPISVMNLPHIHQILIPPIIQAPPFLAPFSTNSPQLRHKLRLSILHNKILCHKQPPLKYQRRQPVGKRSAKRHEKTIKILMVFYKEFVQCLECLNDHRKWTKLKSLCEIIKYEDYSVVCF